MSECITLARKGAGYVSPNPLVGCVIVKDDRIIGKGYHRKYGGPHAEVNAIRNARKNGNSIEGATVYVNLEPCSHKGKTGACAELLASLKPRKVVAGMKDPFRLVNGKGIRILRRAGISVTTGVMESECRELNKFFVKFVTKNLPYVTLKIAQSIDGRIALKNFDSKYISSVASRNIVHKLRSEYDAVLIGRNTALHDDPSLDARMTKGRAPFRIVIDEHNNLPKRLRIFSDDNAGKTIVVRALSGKTDGRKIIDNVISLRLRNEQFNIEELLKEIYRLNIASVLVEGGAAMFSSFIRSGLYDELIFFVAPKILGNGISAFDGINIADINDAIMIEPESFTHSGNDLILKYRNVHGNS